MTLSPYGEQSMVRFQSKGLLLGRIMATIRITGPIADMLGPHPLSLREAFIGCTVEADGQAMATLRKAHPHLTCIPGTYEVTLADALEALVLMGRDEATRYWGDIIRPYCIYVPYDQAQPLAVPFTTES